MPLSVAAGLWLGALALTGGYLDLRWRRLPNWLALVSLVSGLGWGVALAGWPAAPPALLHGLLALLVGIGLFALGGFGGGDAKFYAALATWFPLRDGPLLLATVSITGLLVLALWFAWKATLPANRRRQAKGTAFDGVPYGIAIGIGAIITFALTH